MENNTKMRLSIRLIILLIALNSLLVACKAPLPVSDMPEIGIPEEEFNTKVRLSAPAGWNTFKTDDEIVLTVEVVSTNPVIFPNDYGARLFLWNNGQWLEIDDEMINPEGEIIVSPANNDPRKLGAAGVYPVLPDPNKPAWVRIILIGNVYRNNEATDERVAAYIDVHLTP
jgi:hypothetical protein